MPLPGSDLHMVIAPRAREASVQISPTTRHPSSPPKVMAGRGPFDRGRAAQYRGAAASARLPCARTSGLSGAAPRQSPSFILGPDTYRAAMKAMRHVYRQEFLQPLLVALFPVSGRQHRVPRYPLRRPADRPFPHLPDRLSRHFLGYLLGHMNSAFVFARLYLGIDSDWALATAASGKDAWDTRLMIFVLSHLAAERAR
jgi:hypothetical protein